MPTLLGCTWVLCWRLYNIIVYMYALNCPSLVDQVRNMCFKDTAKPWRLTFTDCKVTEHSLIGWAQNTCIRWLEGHRTFTDGRSWNIHWLQGRRTFLNWKVTQYTLIGKSPNDWKASKHLLTLRSPTIDWLGGHPTFVDWKIPDNINSPFQFNSVWRRDGGSQR